MFYFVSILHLKNFLNIAVRDRLGLLHYDSLDPEEMKKVIPIYQLPGRVSFFTCKRIVYGKQQYGGRVFTRVQKYLWVKVVPPQNLRKRRSDGRDSSDLRIVDTVEAYQ